MRRTVVSLPAGLLLGVGVFAISLVSPAWLIPAVASAAPDTSASGIEADVYTSARTCCECHAEIYNSWKNSLHAFSMTDPIFDAAYIQALKIGGDEARRLCLQRHAPTAAENGDYELKLGVTREGVSCDFCHTETAVHLEDRERRLSVEPGPVKRSVIQNRSSQAHEVAYSELHKTSESCGGCHSYSGRSAKPIMGTDEEWKIGPYASRGVQCQDCHMVPTGMPSREVVLTVVVDHEGRVQTQERRFRKIVADKDGRPLTSDHEALLFGARILNDTRIGPGEQRALRFTFGVSPGQKRSKVTATLSYRYSPVILREQRVEVRMGIAERIVY